MSRDRTDWAVHWHWEHQLICGLLQGLRCGYAGHRRRHVGGQSARDEQGRGRARGVQGGTPVIACQGRSCQRWGPGRLCVGTQCKPQISVTGKMCSDTRPGFPKITGAVPCQLNLVSCVCYIQQGPSNSPPTKPFDRNTCCTRSGGMRSGVLPTPPPDTAPAPAC
jgi:hypothetical protein